jgi:stage IV sporulation protein B
MNQKCCLSSRKKQYRKLLVLLFFFNLIFLIYSYSYKVYSKEVKETEGKVSGIKTVTPCGLPVGIYIKTRGILVLGTQVLHSQDGLNYEPAKNIVRSGDLILQANGCDVTDKKEFQKLVKNSEGKEMTLLIERNGEKSTVKVTPIQTKESGYQLGIWVRDDTQGLGTLTYISGNQFGALGHGISDLDTGTRMEIVGGTLYEAQILSVQKGEKGNPGELIGQVRYGQEFYLGSILKNTGYGIYGTLEKQLEGYSNAQSVPVASTEEIKEGKASVRLVLDGVSKDYEIEIEKVDGKNKDIEKGMVLRITDSELLKKTGGIVQGMSGAPILQNGKWIGAVTHVFVDDPTRGYGVFAQNMLNESEK